MANNRQGNRNPKTERERQLDKAVKAAVEGPKLGGHRKAAQPQKLRRPNREMKKAAEADKAVREIQHNLRVQRQQKAPQPEQAQPERPSLRARLREETEQEQHQQRKERQTCDERSI